MQFHEMAADRDALGARPAVVEFQHRHLGERVLREEGGGPCATARRFDVLLGDEMPGAAREVTPDSHVTVSFRADSAATHLQLRHEGIRREEARKGVGGSWMASFCTQRDVVEGQPA